MAKNVITKAEADGARLIQSLLKHGDMAKAAKDCGITEAEFREHVRKPYMRNFLIMEYSSLLVSELAPLALKQMRQMLQKGRAAPGMIDLCKTVLDRIGVSAAKPHDPAAPDAKPLEDLSIAELQAFISKKEASLKDVTPHSAPPVIDGGPQLSDMFD